MDKTETRKRCRWCNLANPAYVAYHDHEWGVPVHDDSMLYEMLLLETFQAGLSWECILNKREAFRQAFDGFDYSRIALYDESKISSLSWKYKASAARSTATSGDLQAAAQLWSVGLPHLRSPMPYPGISATGG